MTRTHLLGTSRLAYVAVIAATAVIAAPAMAQDANDRDPASTLESEVEVESGKDASSETSIVVTGSRIRRPNLDSSVPITSIGAEDLSNSGHVLVGETLNDLPSLRNTFGQGPSGKSLGTAGLTLLDLRGLGRERTLVLVNGRRHITSEAGRYFVDTGTIPSDLIERVDIVTGGSSAVYGSDAIAGVVNFITRRDFEGVQLNARAGINSRGDRPSYLLGATGGINFADGRGNLAVALEYSKQGALTYADREDITGALGGRTVFQPTDATNGETPAGDGIPDQTIVSGIRSGNISYGGMFQNGNNFYAFDTNGNLQRSICTQTFTQFGSSNCVGGLGATAMEYSQILPGNERYVANLLGHLDVSDSARLFVEAKYVHTESTLVTSPFSISAANVGGFNLGTFSVNNPFLTPQALAVINAERNNSTAPFLVRHLTSALGPRTEDNTRDIYRITGGIEGNFNTDWRYEVSVNYGKLHSDHLMQNYPFPSRYLAAINAVRNAQGQIVCAINANASTADDDPACVPLNVFGEGRASPEALAYVNVPLTRTQDATQLVVSGFISGDSSQAFELPGGPVGFAVGAEYRRETAGSDWDERVSAGQTLVGVIPDFVAPAFEVKEAFGEINAPILKDQPWAHDLSLSAALRMSDYKGGTGTVWAYNMGGTYAPLRALRLRANYSRAVRIPTLTDLYLPAFRYQQGLPDPCDVINISGNPNRAANCAAAGLPANFINQPARTAPSFYTDGGSTNLHEERSDGYTLGLVLVPAGILPGFSLSVDYYSIKVSGVIQKLAAVQILQNCYDSPTGIDNPFCALVQRQPDGLYNPQSAVTTRPLNFAALKTSGVDIDAAYRRDLGPARLDLRALASYIINRDNYTNPLDPTFRDRQKGEVGHPELEAMFSTGLDFGTFNITHKLRYIGKQAAGAWESYHSVDGRPPQNADATDPVFLAARFYHDLSFGFDVNRQLNFYGGISNLLDTNPPVGRVGDTSGDSWDTVGRAFYAGVKAKF